MNKGRRHVGDNTQAIQGHRVTSKFTNNSTLAKLNEDRGRARPGSHARMGMYAGLWTCIGPLDQPQLAWGPGKTPGLSLALQSWSTLAICTKVGQISRFEGGLSGVPIGRFRLFIAGYGQDTWGGWIPP